MSLLDQLLSLSPLNVLGRVYRGRTLRLSFEKFRIYYKIAANELKTDSGHIENG